MIKEDNRTLQELTDAYLNDEAVAQFDAIMARARQKRMRNRIWAWTSGVAAAAILAAVLFLSLPSESTSYEPMTVMEIAQGIEELMNVHEEDVKSIQAIPTGSTTLLIVYMKDGSTSSYILTRNDDGVTTSILALNKKQ